MHEHQRRLVLAAAVNADVHSWIVAAPLSTLGQAATIHCPSGASGVPTQKRHLNSHRTLPLATRISDALCQMLLDAVCRAWNLLPRIILRQQCSEGVSLDGWVVLDAEAEMILI